MSLLEVDRLTVRFGGLTAVSNVSFSVEEGRIFAVIGPNGAGKTTVFNVVSGVYDATSGDVRLAGRTLRRPWSARAIVACLGVALFTALAAGMFSLNVDKLFLAAIKRNAAGQTPFAWSRAAQSLSDYWQGRPAVERRGRNYAVVAADGTPTGYSFRTREQAQDFRERLDKLRAQRLSSSLGKADENGPFNLQIDAAEKLHVTARARRIAFGWSVGGAFVLALTGSVAVWNRARRTPEVVARAGIARTFQNIRLFHNMTVLENVLVGLDGAAKPRFKFNAIRPRGARSGEQSARRKAQELLDFVGLSGRADLLARNLPYGDQRRLEIVRALATEPKLLLLDEPAAGMNPSESQALTVLIEDIRQRGVSVLLIEHHMRLVMGISQRIAVLDHGVKIAEGTPDEIRADGAVVEAYLGSDGAE